MAVSVDGLGYAAAELPVSPETAAAHVAALDAFAQPGAWWSGADRLAIVEEARAASACSRCAAAPAGALPATAAGCASGEQDDADALPPAAVAAIHGIRNHSGQLGRRWFEHLIDMGLPREAYVEVASLVASAVIVDSFAMGVGVSPPPLPLPAAAPGAPSFAAAADVADAGAWLPIAREGRANILRALGLVPSAGRLFFDTFAPSYFMRPESSFALEAPQVELVAARVSAVHECFY